VDRRTFCRFPAGNKLFTSSDRSTPAMAWMRDEDPDRHCAYWGKARPLDFVDENFSR
jgi:hypothetical protein